jgi:AraC-like DNA-binding protein
MHAKKELSYYCSHSMEPFEKIDLYQRIVRAKLFIDQHYDESIDLNNIADQAHFSKFHFIRVFKSLYGFTPNQYLIKVRIDRAKLLLEQGASVLAACTLVGFDSATSFAATFRRLAGMAPSVYQSSQESKQTQIKQNPLRFVPNCFAETHGWTK